MTKWITPYSEKFGWKAFFEMKIILDICQMRFQSYGILHYVFVWNMRHCDMLSWHFVPIYDIFFL